ncbi:MAG: LamG-like jellyroll fold domain-containing protein [Minisyncoccia bacterium]
MFNNLKNFSKIEFFIYLTIIFFIFLASYFYYSGNIIKIRDEQRKQDLLLLKSRIDNYFKKNNIYPISTSWICFDNSDLQKQISDNILRDPLFNENNSQYCYRYKTSKDGKEFKLYCILEGTGELFQVYSEKGQNLFTSLPFEDPWFSPNFEFRKKIKILPFKDLNSDLKDFPFLLSISSEDFKNKNLNANKIIFFDPEKKEIIPKEIISINNETGNILSFLKLDEAPLQKEKDIYIYYDNTATSLYKINYVYNENFVCVFHFDELNFPLDSTKNNILLLSDNNISKKENGKIYKSLFLDGTSGLSLRGLQEDKLLDGFTFQIWIFPKGEIKPKVINPSNEETNPSNEETNPSNEETNPSNITNTPNEINTTSTNDIKNEVFDLNNKEYKNKPIFVLQDKNGNNLGLYLSFYVTSTTSTNSTSSQNQEKIMGNLNFLVNNENFNFPQNVKLNEWNFLSFLFSKDKLTLFINRNKEEISYNFSGRNFYNSESYFLIGKSNPNSQESNYFSGLIDELQISKIILPVDWTFLSFENQDNPIKNIQLEKEERF